MPRKATPSGPDIAWAPMLAEKLKGRMNLVRLPAYFQPKVDGYRLLTLPPSPGSDRLCRAVARSLEPFRNDHIRDTIEHSLPPGLDGEVTIRGVPFHKGGGMMRAKAGR